MASSPPIRNDADDTPVPTAATGHKRRRQLPHFCSTGSCLPTTGNDVLLVGERTYTQVLATALLHVGSGGGGGGAALQLYQRANGTPDPTTSTTTTTSGNGVDELIVKALERTYWNDTGPSRAIWKRRHVHLLESLLAADHETALISFNHIVIVVPAAFSPDLWETIPASAKVIKELDAVAPGDCLRQKVSLLAMVMDDGGHYSGEPDARDASIPGALPLDSTELFSGNNNQAHYCAHVPLLVCHANQSQSLHAVARQLWKRTAIGMRTDPVSTVSPLVLAKRRR